MMSLSPQQSAENSTSLKSFSTISIPDMAKNYNITKRQLSIASGVSYQAITRTDRQETKNTENTALRSLRSLAALLNRVEPWAGSKFQAWAWFIGEPIPAFGYRTAQQVFKDENGPEALSGYLDGISEGGYA